MVKSLKDLSFADSIPDFIFFFTKKMLNLAWNLLLTMVLLLYFLLLNSCCY